MSLFDPRPATAALEELFARERAALLSGKLDALAQLAPLRERLLTRLARERPDPEAAARLRRTAARNQAMLEAAAEALTSVRAHIDELRRAPAPLKTYDGDGRTTSIARGPAAPDLNRRA